MIYSFDIILKSKQSYYEYIDLNQNKQISLVGLSYNCLTVHNPILIISVFIKSPPKQTVWIYRY